MVLHAIGKEYEWQLHVVDRQENIMCDLIPFTVQELTFPERERLKEKGKRYLGKWEFKAVRKMQNAMFIQNVRSQSMEKQARKKNYILEGYWSNGIVYSHYNKVCFIKITNPFHIKATCYKRMGN